MISTGNDIVALSTINIHRTSQPNFYSKIITQSEKALYDKRAGLQLSLVNFVWLSWSVKESAYKYLQRLDPTLVFSPSNILIEQLNMPDKPYYPNFEKAEIEGIGFNDSPVCNGKVVFKGQVLHYCSIICPEFIASVVNNGSFNQVYWGIKLIDNPDTAYQSKTVRAFAIKRLSIILQTEDVQIVKSCDGYPIILVQNKETSIPLSIAHHDRFIAYTFHLSL